MKQIIRNNDCPVFMPLGLFNMEDSSHEVYVFLSKQPYFRRSQSTAIKQPVKYRDDQMPGRGLFMRSKVVRTIEKCCNFGCCEYMRDISRSLRSHLILNFNKRL